jgi:glycosyltransferase involved in cell wall biosynthesis
MSESPSFEMLEASMEQTPSAPVNTPTTEQVLAGEPNEEPAEQAIQSAEQAPKPAEEEQQYVEPAFSICIIAKDAENTLPRLAESLEGFLRGGGQVVLLDTGSSDGTAQLARQLGFEVHQAEPGTYSAKMRKLDARMLLEKYADPKDVSKLPFRQGLACFNFSAARNAVAKLAKHDQQLHIDASDQVYSLDVAFLNSLLASGLNSLFYTLSNKLENAHAEAVATANRFYDRRLQRWEGITHEELYAVDNVASSAIRMSTVPIQALDVIHYRQSAKSRDGYLIGVAIDVAQHPHNAQMLHNLGRQLFYSNFEASALKVLSKHLIMEYSLTSRRALSACFIAQIWVRRADVEQQRVKAEIETLRRQQREPDEPAVLEMAKRVTKLYDNARNAYLQAFQLDAGWRSPVIGLSDLAARVKDWERAIFWAKAAQTIQRKSFVSEDASHYSYAIDEILMKGYFNLWKAANEAKQSVATELFGHAYAAYERCREQADWLPSVKKFGELFKFDEDYARQSVKTGDFKE